MVDVIVLLIVIFFALVGLRKGAGHYLFELLIMSLGLGAGWLYYLLRQEILKSLLVLALVFFGLSFLKWFLQRSRQKTAGQKLACSFANRFWGAVLGLSWGTFIVGLFILTIDLLPSGMFVSYNIKQQIRSSRASGIIQRLVPVKEVPIVKNISYMSAVSLDEQAKERLREQPQFQEILQHASFKAILEDEQLLQQLQDQDLPQLLTNPKILNLLNDGQFVEKLMKLDFKKIAPR